MSPLIFNSFPLAAPPKHGGALGHDGEVALLSPCCAQRQKQDKDGLALLVVIVARLFASRPRLCPGPGTQHLLGRSAGHRRPGPSCRCLPRMRSLRTRWATRGPLRGLPAHGPDISREKAQRDVEAHGRDHGQEDGRACTDRGAEGELRCSGQGAAAFTPAPQSLVQVRPGDFSAAPGPHRGGARCEVLV